MRCPTCVAVQEAESLAGTSSGIAFHMREGSTREERAEFVRDAFEFMREVERLPRPEFTQEQLDEMWRGYCNQCRRDCPQCAGEGFVDAS